MDDPMPIALRAELLNDPASLGYAAPYAAGDDTAVASRRQKGQWSSVQASRRNMGPL